MTDDGAETILSLPHAPIQIDMAVPCMTTPRGATDLILRMNHEPLISAAPMRSDNFETDIGYSTR